MAKHAVPKKKTPKSKSKKRYGSFKTKVLTQLSNKVHLVDCPKCGAKALAHTACKECGQYKGRQVVAKKSAADKVTTIKA